MAGWGRRLQTALYTPGLPSGPPVPSPPCRLLHSTCTSTPPSPSSTRATQQLQEVSATRADFYLALSLRPDAPRPLARSRSGSPACDGAAASSSLQPRRRGSLVGGASKRLAGEGCEVEVVFPCLRPRLSLLRQVYQQLQPLLQADLETLQQGTEAAAAGAAAQQNGGTAQTPQGERLPEREGQRRSPRRRRAETL